VVVSQRNLAYPVYLC